MTYIYSPLFVLAFWCIGNQLAWMLTWHREYPDDPWNWRVPIYGFAGYPRWVETRRKNSE